MICCSSEFQLLPKNVVITGGSRGLGKSLARSFILRGDNVLITARNAEMLNTTMNELLSNTKRLNNIYSVVGDVSSLQHCELIKEKAIQNMGTIDIWINNAGTNCSRTDPFDLFSEDEVREIVDTNLYGTINGSKVMLDVMKSQNHGLLINVEGAGSNGFSTPNHAVYGMTKKGITHFTKSLMKEYASYEFNICTISPGMILTDMLLGDDSNIQKKDIFNIICEESDYVSEFLVRRITNASRHEHICYLTLHRIIWLLLLGLIRKHRHFDKNGNRIKKDT
jgi:chlorophyll(ide) b reductase